MLYLNEHLMFPPCTVDKDIADGKGVVFAHKGDRINPLEHVPFRETLYFIDGDDKRQIDWMKQQKPDTVISKIVLVNGNIKTSGESLNAQVYFDQNGTLSRKFQLDAVPARVTVAADGKRLRWRAKSETTNSPYNAMRCAVSARQSQRVSSLRWSFCQSDHRYLLGMPVSDNHRQHTGCAGQCC